MRSLKLIGVPAQIRTGHRPKTSQQLYRVNHFVYCYECETWSFIPKEKHRLRAFENKNKQEWKMLQKLSS
jgi:hypothetical protein